MFDQDVWGRPLLLNDAADPELEELTATALNRKFNRLSFLPHTIVRNGSDTVLTPAEMDPGIYDGPEKYKITPGPTGLHARLQDVMSKNRDLAHISVALVDLTKDINKPEFADHHKGQRFVASVAKIAPMLAAYQLRKDIRVAYAQKSAKSLPDLFDLVRDDWAATQKAGARVAFTKGVTLLGKLVLVSGSSIPLGVTKAPQLGNVLTMPSAGSAASIDFQSTGENRTQLDGIGDAFNLAFEPPRGDKRTKAQLGKDRRDSIAVVDSLGFLERLRLAIGGVVPVSNFAVATIVRDVGYAYIASTLLQCGLYDPARGGGLWLGSDFWSKKWRSALAGGVMQSATAGSLAAFMTLLAQDRLVDASSSAEMRALLQKTPLPTTHPTIVSTFEQGLAEKVASALIQRVLSKLGVLNGIDDCTFFERKLSAAPGAKTLRYVAVGLRAGPKANASAQMKKLIKLLDDCIVANNP